MSETVDYRVTGLSEVVSALQRMGVDVEDLKDAFSKIAAEGAQAAARFAPHRTGRLAGSIYGNRAKSKAVITTRLIYAGPINYGWPRRNISPSLFMQKADQAIAPRAVQMLEDEVNNKIREKRFR